VGDDDGAEDASAEADGVESYDFSVRSSRVILEGLLVTFPAALVLYELRHHLVSALIVAILVYLVGLWAIGVYERHRNEANSQSSITSRTSTPISVRPDFGATFASSQVEGIARQKCFHYA
jgi:hypothetical protein